MVETDFQTFRILFTASFSGTLLAIVLAWMVLSQDAAIKRDDLVDIIVRLFLILGIPAFATYMAWPLVESWASWVAAD